MAASSGVVLLLQSDGVAGSDSHNVRTMFVAGLAEGMGKPTLILSPHGYMAPLDIRDDVQSFRTEADIVAAVADFVPLIVAHFTETNPVPAGPATLLQSISIGDPRAENEMTTLGRYYLKTDQFERAIRGEVNLVVGRKGSGKTALFVRARDKTRTDKRNIMVDLMPEGYQLIKLKEDILEYLTEGARQHLITAFWEYLILLEVAYKLLEKDKPLYKHNHEIHELYVELKRTYSSADFASEGDFSERLLMLSNRLADKYHERFGKQHSQKLTNADVTELLYSHDLATLQRQISAYLEKKQSVWVFFDNLDRGWSTQGVELIDAIVLRCLVDAGRKVEREMRRNKHEFHCIVFVRNDVYDHVMRQSPDYGRIASSAIAYVGAMRQILTTGAQCAHRSADRVGMGEHVSVGDHIGLGPHHRARKPAGGRHVAMSKAVHGPPCGLCGARARWRWLRLQAEREPRDDMRRARGYLSFAFKLTSQRACVYVMLVSSTAKVIAVGGIFRR